MKTRNHKTWTVTAGIIICAAALLTTGCGSKKGVSDKQFRQNITERVSEISDYGLKLDSVKTENRLTSSKDCADLIWADITASNEHCTFTGHYQFHYTLYDSGWFLDLVDPLETEIIPKIPAEDFPQAIADSAVEEMGYTNYWLENRNENTDSITFKYGAYDTDGTEMVISMDYEFAPDSGWYQFTASSLSANVFGW